MIFLFSFRSFRFLLFHPYKPNHTFCENADLSLPPLSLYSIPLFFTHDSSYSFTSLLFFLYLWKPRLYNPSLSLSLSTIALPPLVPSHLYGPHVFSFTHDSSSPFVSFLFFPFRVSWTLQPSIFYLITPSLVNGDHTTTISCSLSLSLSYLNHLLSLCFIFYKAPNRIIIGRKKKSVFGIKNHSLSLLNPRPEEFLDFLT